VRRCAFCMVVLALAIAVPVRAAENNNARALVEEILQLTKADETMRRMQDEMRKMIAAQLESMDFDGKGTEAFQKEFDGVFSSVFTDDLWKRLRDPLIDAYVRVYSTEELAELRDFYKSPLGQKMIAKMPELMRESLKASQEVMQDLIPELQAKVAALIEEKKE